MEASYRSLRESRGVLSLREICDVQQKKVTRGIEVNVDCCVVTADKVESGVKASEGVKFYSQVTTAYLKEFLKLLDLYNAYR